MQLSTPEMLQSLKREQQGAIAANYKIVSIIQERLQFRPSEGSTSLTEFNKTLTTANYYFLIYRCNACRAEYISHQSHTAITAAPEVGGSPRSMLSCRCARPYDNETENKPPGPNYSGFRSWSKPKEPLPFNLQSLADTKL